MPDEPSPAGRATWHMADDTLASIQDTLRDLIRPLADTGDTFACDLLHDRIARIGDVRAILTDEDDSLTDLLTRPPT